MGFLAHAEVRYSTDGFFLLEYAIWRVSNRKLYPGEGSLSAITITSQLIKVDGLTIYNHYPIGRLRLHCERFLYRTFNLATS